MKSIHNSDLVEKWISDYIYFKKIFNVTQNLYPLLNAGTISDEMEGKINDFWTKKWKDHSRYLHYLFKRYRVWLDKEINIQDILTKGGSKENTNKDLINRLLLTSDHLIND